MGRRPHRGGPAKRTQDRQIPICWGADKQRAIERAHELFRWFGGGWHVNANLPTPVACGPDLDELAESVQPFLDAGFTDVALVQVGDESQDEFLADIAAPLMDRLRNMNRNDAQ